MTTNAAIVHNEENILGVQRKTAFGSCLPPSLQIRTCQTFRPATLSSVSIITIQHLTDTQLIWKSFDMRHSPGFRRHKDLNIGQWVPRESLSKAQKSDSELVDPEILYNKVFVRNQWDPLREEAYCRYVERGLMSIFDTNPLTDFTQILRKRPHGATLPLFSITDGSSPSRDHTNNKSHQYVKPSVFLVIHPDNVIINRLSNSVTGSQNGDTAMSDVDRMSPARQDGGDPSTISQGELPTQFTGTTWAEEEACVYFVCQQSFTQEASAYDRLERLQGNVIPRLYGLVTTLPFHSSEAHLHGTSSLRVS